MARKVLIKIRQKPNPPVKKKDYLYKLDAEYYSLKDIVKYADAYEIPHDKFFCEVELNYSFGNNEKKIFFIYKGLEPEEEYIKRQKDYEERKNQYDKWYEKNKNLIEKELELRTIEKEQKLQKQIEREKALKDKEIKQLEKKLKLLKLQEDI